MRAARLGHAAPLFYKNFVALFVAVVVPLVADGASEAWFGYRDQPLDAEARVCTPGGIGSGKIVPFSTTITDQLQMDGAAALRTAWTSGHRFDVIRLMRQVPAVVEVTLSSTDRCRAAARYARRPGMWVDSGY